MQKRKMAPMIVALIAILVICLVGGIAGGFYLINVYSQIKDVENSKAFEPALPEQNSNEVQVNPIDFASLAEQNSDVYAWIYLPGTDINFPVCQNLDDASYYLSHNARKEESQLGAVFSEAQFNNKDFQDPVTVLYGHNGFGDTMFTALHQFESSEFFNAHTRFYIYTPEHIYTYQIVSAFMSDGNHLMGSFNFQTEKGRQEFIQHIQNPNAVGAITGHAEMNIDSKFVVLSTCNTGSLESVGRYLVCGVKINDTSTK